MGYASRANPVARRAQRGLLEPKPSKARAQVTYSRPTLAAMIREFCGLGDLPLPVLPYRGGRQG